MGGRRTRGPVALLVAGLATVSGVPVLGTAAVGAAAGDTVVAGAVVSDAAVVRAAGRSAADALPADAAELGCLMRGNVAFSPGVTGDPQYLEMRISGSLYECQGTTPHAGGEFRGATSGTMSCSGGDAKGSIEITWDGRNSSVVDLAAGDVGELPPTFQGRVSRGALAGRAVTLRVEAVDGVDPEDCAKPRGVTAMAVYGSAEFTT
ncbi:hypothetical protein LX15_004915 [Streptoalloteichus tenebrarius]|uniref:Uncharacterized protein n=1 Tax=Streptoalloteichus tenebrarius (strain ATCC 17920 / DSM 40477 / JCM 4838 / CBS 697.72 / NBRC 16177 / NCIMB 11028 / NRRL B-12390 / A12253. 1 / ISP 5477) TaxID=1933 RepID=A0ABT1I080_STRSD|nr:hypothetical protein [Streptoalloteichus tenebrarius]MCP2261194.1 hypothetical protein [Streptoalloteichus tenebrarius]BFF02946.1 hypothetical protein GCM10020241_46210 [Streptoalloteichus tenebrarius]